MDRPQVFETLVRAADVALELTLGQIEAACKSEDTPGHVITALIGEQPIQVASDPVVRINAWRVVATFGAFRRALADLAPSVERVVAADARAREAAKADA